MWLFTSLMFLTLKLVAIVVYLVLDVERTVRVEVVLAACKKHVHLCERLVGELEHLVHMLILLLGEVFPLALNLQRDGAGNVVATVSDALYLAYLAQHGTNLSLRLIAEVRVAHVVEILGNLYFHVVAYAFILLYARIELVEGRLVLLSEQLTHHREHSLYALGKGLYLFLSLKNRKLRCLHDATADKAQTEVLLLVTLLRLDDIAHDALYLWYEPYQDKCVGEVETGVEGGQTNDSLAAFLRKAACPTASFVMSES